MPGGGREGIGARIEELADRRGAGTATADDEHPPVVEQRQRLARARDLQRPGRHDSTWQGGATGDERSDEDAERDDDRHQHEADHDDQPVGRDRGMALEESQSLLLEMVVGHSEPFVRYLQPLLLKHFGVTGPEWEPGNIYKRLTRVHRGLIRVDADELNYSLHIMQRYEIEKQLLSGKLAVRDLPEAWNAGMEQRFGQRPAGAADGCLQDMHWALGSFGYYPSYALGLVIAAQLWEALRAQLPEVDALIERGDLRGGRAHVVAARYLPLR